MLSNEAHKMLESKEHRDEIIQFHNNVEETIGLPKDTEDKKWYCKYGEMIEPFFIKLYGPGTPVNMGIKMNPEKETNVYVKDYISTKDKNVFMDLKGQCVTFFTSGYKYKIDPQKEKTLNVYDIEEYIKMEKEQNVKIYLLIWLLVWNKKQLEEYNNKFNTNVYLMEGLWATRPSEILALPDKRRPIHISKLRGAVDSEKERAEKHYHNKKPSYVIDCSDLKKEIFCKKWEK